MLNQNALAHASEGSVSPLAGKILGYVVDVCLYAIIALVPLFFLPLTLDVLELNKQTLLIILVLIGTTAWLGKALVDRSFMLSRAWLHLVVVLFAAGWLVTSLFSKDLYLSLVGNFGQMQWSFATVAAFVLFYVLIANRVGTTKKLYAFILAFLASSILVNLFGFLQMLGVFPLGWVAAFSKVNTFNTIGTINALGVYAVIPLILAASLTVFSCKDMVCSLGDKKVHSVLANVIVWLSMVTALAVMIIVDFWVIWAAAIFGLVLLVAIPLIRSAKIHHPVRVAIPVVLACISVLLLIFRTPIDLKLPAEVSPSASASWSIAKSVLSESPLFGTGPGTWIYDYAKFRSPAVNLSQFWTVRFERGLSTFFTLIAMIGLVGIALWLILVVSAIAMSVVHLIKEKDDDSWQAYLTVFVGWATVTFIAFVYNYNLAHHFAFWFLLALLGALLTRRLFSWDTSKSNVTSVLLSILFIVLCVAGLSTAWLAGQRLAADAAYSSSVVSYRGGQPIDQAIDSLNRAVSMNRLNDVYYRNLSQAYLIKGGQLLQTAEQDPEAPAKINQLVNAALDTARKASEISPMNVDNWENLAVINLSIANFTQGADELAIKNFEQALDREPNNPAYSNEIGKIYLLRADSAATLTQSKDETAKSEAEQAVKDNLDKAAEWFNRSIQAKPDFAPAHYFLGLVYERQGRLSDAITKLEQVLSVNNQDVGVAFQLGILYYRNENKDKALDLFEQIINFSPDYANARWYLSAMYEENGRYQDALDQVKKVQEANKDNELVTQRIQYLEGLIAKNGESVSKTLPDPVEEKITGPAQDNAIQQ